MLRPHIVRYLCRGVASIQILGQQRELAALCSQRTPKHACRAMDTVKAATLSGGKPQHHFYGLSRRVSFPVYSDSE